MAALGGGIEDQREAESQRLQDQTGQHFDIAARMPDAQPMAPGRFYAQIQEIAPAEPCYALRNVGSKPRRVAMRGDQRGDGPVDRRAAGIAPAQIGDDDFDLVQNFILAQLASPLAWFAAYRPSKRLRVKGARQSAAAAARLR